MKKLLLILTATLTAAIARADYHPWGTAPDGFIILGVDEFGHLYGGPGYYGTFWGHVDPSNDTGWLRSSDGHAWRIINGRFYNP